jgi:alpha-tubulin suppressor-like RCC1 family protein
MPNPITNFRDSSGVDLGNKLITKEYLMTVYPQIANQLITPELWVWGSNPGDNTFTQRSTPVTTLSGGANWKQVSSGNGHTAAIKTDGTLWTWGFNSAGRLGINSSVNSVCTPVTTFAGGTNWKQVSCGSQFTAAIKTDGTLWVWGTNTNNAQLGINTTSSRSTPVTTFAGGTNWKQVSCGGQHAAAIKTDGTLWTWGRNTGALGDNTQTTRLTPVTTFAGGTNWKQVASGYFFTLAIKTDGTLWTWGTNSYGILGDNTGTTRCTPVTTFAGGTNWKQVAANSSNGSADVHGAAIKTDGTLWIWGGNNSWRLGINDPSITTNRFTPVTTFAGGTNWKQVSCGAKHTAAIKTDGTLWTWGQGSSGQLGIDPINVIGASVTGTISNFSSVFSTSNTSGVILGDEVISSSPFLNAAMGNVTSISTNTSITFSGLYAAGGTYSGTITLGKSGRLTPVTTFAGGTNWKQVGSGGYHTSAIKTSDDLQGI